jgi:hypothetical protein
MPSDRNKILRNLYSLRHIIIIIGFKLLQYIIIKTVFLINLLIYTF